MIIDVQRREKMSEPTERMDFQFNSDSRTFSIHGPFKYPLTFTSKILDTEELKARVCALLEYTQKNPKAMELVIKSLEKGPILVSFKPQSELFSGAHFRHRKREMDLLATETNMCEVIYLFIFELNNSINNAVFIAYDKCKNAAEYAYQKEIAEHQTVIHTSEIIKARMCQQDDGQECATCSHHRVPRTLEKWLIDVMIRKPHNGLSHFDSYQVDYLDSKISELKDDLSNFELVRIQNFEVANCSGEELNENKLRIEKELKELERQREIIMVEARNWMRQQKSLLFGFGCHKTAKYVIGFACTFAVLGFLMASGSEKPR